MSDTTSAGYEDCPQCQGKGGIWTPNGFKECTHCGGTGQVEINRFIDWGIPRWSPYWDRRKAS